MRRLALLLLGALLAGGCRGGDDDRPRVPEGDALKIYSSLPRHGGSARAAAAVAQGQRLALEDRNGRAGGRRVDLVALDSSAPGGLTWDPSIVKKNAERAAGDKAAIAYLGELDNGGSAISVPVTNDAGLLQLSPQDSLTSLTQIEPGGPRGGPERYYPDDARTFARLVPTDLSHATALVDWARERGAKRIAILHDDQLHGRAIAAQAVFVADARKLPVVAVKEVESADEPESYADTAQALAEEKQPPDAVIYAGAAQATAAPLLAATATALPDAQLYATGFPPEQGVGASRGVRITGRVRPARDYPPRAQRVLDRIAERQNGTEPPVAALYGYETMRLALEAIDRARARAGDRAAVAREALRPGPRENSVLGDLALTRAGDIEDQSVTVYRRDGDRLTVEGVRDPRPPALPPAPGDPSS